MSSKKGSSGKLCLQGTHLSFAIGDEVDGEDIFQMDPGRGELDVQSTDNIDY